MDHKEVYSRISRSLSTPRLLEDLNVSPSFIKKHVQDNDFKKKLCGMIEEKDFSCRAVLDLTQGMLDELCSGNPPENWLYYIYQFSLYKSFPDAVVIDLNEDLSPSCYLYLTVLRTIDEYQKECDDGTWLSKYPMIFLSREEEKALENPIEYIHFLNAFNGDYIYEMMKLSSEALGYTTLDHICGVHHLALSLGRQLQKTGIPVDLGRVSGAAAGHDIGKYGCKGMELKRVPYLHYYYTDQWFKKFDINYISHIAVNHSTWDLELENLPIESLILIYSDFRVKNITHPDGSSSMHFYTLKDSFDVILEKLDDVDDAKYRRYQRVYAKLKDFENYLLKLKINTDPDSKLSEGVEWDRNQSYSLVQGQDVVESLKHLAIDHNINLMHQFRDEFSLDNILQSARSQTDWKSLREYIRIFEEYSTYLTQKQKIQTLRFLFEFLTHPEDDIRRDCAELIGALIAIYDEDYRKEIPENVSIHGEHVSSAQLFDEYLRLFLYPGHKYVDEYQGWIGYSTSIMVHSLFTHSPDKLRGEFLNILLEYYRYDNSKDKETQLYLLKTAEHIPLSYSSQDFEVVFNFVLQMLKRQHSALRLAGLETAYNLLLHIDSSSRFCEELKTFIKSRTSRSKHPAENFMKLKIARLLAMESKILDKLNINTKMDKNKIPEIFLSNLKTATDWVVKRMQIEILLEHTLENPKVDGLHTAIHFCNLLKVSAVEAVRSYAGDAILKIMPCLSLDKRNEVAVELIRALEIEGYHFTEYIPKYLGQLMLWLQPVELDELIDDISEKIKQSNTQIKSLLLKTIGVCIANYSKYSSIFSEDQNAYDKRLVKMLGTLLNALGDYNIHVKQIAFSVFGKDIFGSKHLKLEQKADIFRLTAKKILVLLVDDKSDELLFLTNSAGLNHIYRFISDYIFFKGNIDIAIPQKVAFFPGTFDPFSLSHKQIVKLIVSMGFEVYLAIDEFSWSKRTLPNLLRRKIASISTSDELGVYLYPENYPANIANAGDLKILKENFGSSEVYMVVGSDVILNASSYQSEKTEDSIFTFPHIIIDRGHDGSKIKNGKMEEIISRIEGECLRVTLPKEYVEISSTQIRKHIDENRDISNFVDPLAEQYIFEHGFYQREPQDKALLQSSISLEITIEKSFPSGMIDELASLSPDHYDNAVKTLREFSQKSSARMVTIRDAEQNNKLLGYSIFHWVPSSDLYNEFRDANVSEYIRKNTVGRIILIDGIKVEGRTKNKPLEQILLTETLAFCLARDYQCALYRNYSKEYASNSVYEVLKLQGFEKLPFTDDANPVFVVDISNPSVLNLDVETIIKEPFRSNPSVRQAILRSRRNLQEVMTRLYPGHLVLSFDINVQHELMIKKICSENQMPTSIVSPRKLGPSMCVPYGNIFDRYVIPNTVTKALHTEKFFEPDMKNFTIGPFPYYLNLDIQAKTIHSFNRPVILVDDLLHKGHRVKAVDAVFKKEDVKVQKIIVGILSGRGKELMDIQNREVESIYFLPKLRIWFNENALYPFMGGDALWRGVYPERNLLPSINYILPYTSPTFIKGASNASIYNMSKASIENAIDIMSALENEYHLLNGRNLTVAHLGEVFLSPRCPDHGRFMEYDLNLSPSHFLKNDLELLSRLEDTIVRI